jgi:hypothetical protein
MPGIAAHRLAPFAVALLVLTLIAGCTRIQGPREWTMTAERSSGETYTVSVRDNSGRIEDVSVDPVGVAVPAGIANAPGQPNVVLIPWTGGACDRTTAFAINATATGLALTIRTTVAPGGCDAIGIGHVLQLRSSQPLPPAAITWTP